MLIFWLLWKLDLQWLWYLVIKITLFTIQSFVQLTFNCLKPSVVFLTLLTYSIQETSRPLKWRVLHYSNNLYDDFQSKPTIFTRSAWNRIDRFESRSTCNWRKTDSINVKHWTVILQFCNTRTLRKVIAIITWLIWKWDKNGHINMLWIFEEQMKKDLLQKAKQGVKISWIPFQRRLNGREQIWQCVH